MLGEKIKSRIFIIQVVSAVLLSTVAIRLGYLQISAHNQLLSLASELWQRSFPIEPSRGIIRDRNGEPLAVNMPVMSVAVIPYQIKNKEATANRLADILGANQKTILEKISKRESVVRLQPEGRKISEAQVNKIGREKLEGVYLIQDTERYYPYHQLLAPTLGFVGIDNQGLAGLENYYEQYLRGTRGALSYFMDAKGGLFKNYSSKLIAPIDGMSIELTIDLKIQSIIEREAENAYLMYNPDSLMILAMRPKTGEILGLTNRPTYNPNNYSDYQQEVYNRNLPLWKAIEPGSTFKVFSFAAALNENKIDMYNDYYYDKGYEIVGGQTIKSWKKGGHGLQTFLEVLQNSSNPGFVEIARRLGKDNLYNYIKNFGFSTKTGVDITGEAAGIMFGYDNYNELEQATSAFGQGLTTTPLQMVTALSSLINGGNLMQPYIVKSVSTANSKDVVYQKEPVVVRKVISNEASEKMKDALEHVVALGSGTRAYIDGYRVGGKTGTAQIAENGVYLDGEYNLNFMGAAPINDPEIVVYVNLEKPRNNVQYGGTVAAPIARNILRDSLEHLKVKKQDYQLTRKYTWMDTKTHLVPNYIGMDVKDVRSQLFKFTKFGEGTKVIDQLPRVGERIEEGSTIVLMLG